MDPRKRETVLQMVQALWQRKLNSLNDLKDGRFYIHALNLLYQFQKKVQLDQAKDRLKYTKTFLQGIYGENRVEKYLKFHLLESNSATLSQADEEFELGKIALVLYAIGCLDKNHRRFVEPALELPVHMHADIRALIQAVVQAGSVEMLLTDNIEVVLSSPSDDITSPPPNQIPHFSGASTPKDLQFFTFTPPTNNKDSHCTVKNNMFLNNSLTEISSPLKDLTINTASPASPFLQFVQSPQVIQKAALIQKDTEVRKLKQQLVDEQYAKDALQDQLRGQLALIAQKDAENAALKEKIKKLLTLQDEVDKLEELRFKYAALEVECNKLTMKVADHENCKGQIQYLEKVSDEQSQELDKLYKKIRALDEEREKNTAFRKNIQKLESEIENLQSDLKESIQFKKAWTSERKAILANLEQAKQLNNVLRQELEECQATQSDNTQGENMGVILEIQIRELRSEVDALHFERNALKLQINDMQRRMYEKDKKIEFLKSKESEVEINHKKEVEELTNQLQVSDTQYKECFKQIQNLEENIQGQDKMLIDRQKEVEELTSQLLVSDMQKTEYMKQIQHLEENIQGQGEMLINRKKEVEELTSQLQVSDMQKTEYMKQIQQLEENIQGQGEMLINRKKEVEELTSQLLVSDMQKTEYMKQIQHLEENIQGQGEMLINRKKEVEELTSQLQVSDMQKTEYMKQIQQLEENIQGQGEMLINRKKEVEELTSQLLVSDMQKTEYMKQIQHLEENIQGQGEMLINRKKEVEELTSQLQVSDMQKTEYMKQIQQLEENIQGQGEMLINRKKEVEELTSQLLVSDMQKTEYMKQIQHLEENIQGQGEMLINRKKEVEELTSQLQVSDMQKTEYMKQIQQLEENIQGQGEMLINRKKEVEELTSQLLVSDMQKTEYMKQIQHLEENIQGQGEMLINRKKEVEELTSQLQVSDMQKTEYMKQIQQLEENIQGQGEMLINRKKEVEELTSQLLVSDMQKTEYMKQIQHLEENIQGQGEMLINRKKEVEELTSQLQVSDMQKTEYMKQIQQLEENIQGQGEMLINRKKEVEELTSQLLVSDMQKTEYMKQIQHLEENIQGQGEMLINRKKEVEELTSQLQVSDMQKTEYMKQIQQLEENIQGQGEMLINRKKEVEELTSQLLVSDMQKTEYMKQIQHLEENIQGQGEMLINRQKEVEELTSQLLVSDMQKTEYMKHIQHLEADVKKFKKMCRTLQEEAITLREREKQILNEYDVKILKAKDFCNNLKKQLNESNKKLEECNEEAKRLTQQSERADLSLQKIKTFNESLDHALKLEKETNSILKKRTEAQEHTCEEMRQMLETAQRENTNYAAEISRLKTAVDYSDRKIREYKHLLDHPGTVHLGDSSHFKKIIEEEVPGHLGESISTVDSKRKLRSHTASDDSFHASSDETILTADKVMLRRENLASTTDLRSNQTSGKPHQTEDRLSLCSVPSAQSVKSERDVPVGFLPNATSCANEPEDPDFEWDRLNELQRRNTLYLPHMKSAYPVELQTSRKRITDDSIRLSLMPDGRGKASPGRYNTRQKDNTRTGYGQPVRNDQMAVKRKAMVKQGSDEQSFDESPAKQLRTAPVFQRPGPPTPAKHPPRSGKFTPSHGASPAANSKIKSRGSPIARPIPRLTPGRKPSRRSPRLITQPSQSSSSDENDRRQSVAFNICFTPGKPKVRKGFLQKTKGGENREAQADQQVSSSVDVSHKDSLISCESRQMHSESVELCLNIINSSSVSKPFSKTINNINQLPFTSNMQTNDQGKHKSSEAQSDPGVPAVRQSDPGVPAVRQRDPGVPAVRQRDPGVPAVRQSDPGVPAVRQSDPGVPAVRQSDPGVPAVRQSDPGMPAVRQRDPCVPAVRQSDPGMPAVRQRDPGMPAVRQSDPDFPFMKQSDPDIPVVKQIDPDIPAMKQSDPDLPTMKQSEFDLPVMKQSDPCIPAMKQSEYDLPVIRQIDPGVLAMKQSDPESLSTNEGNQALTKTHFERILGIKAFRFDDGVNELSQSHLMPVMSHNSQNCGQKSAACDKKRAERNNSKLSNKGCNKPKPHYDLSNYDDKSFKAINVETLKKPAVIVDLAENTPCGTNSVTPVHSRTKPPRRKLFSHFNDAESMNKICLANGHLKDKTATYDEARTSFHSNTLKKRAALAIDENKEYEHPPIRTSLSTVSSLKRKFESSCDSSKLPNIAGCAQTTFSRVKSPRLEENLETLEAHKDTSKTVSLVLSQPGKEQSVLTDSKGPTQNPKAQTSDQDLNKDNATNENKKFKFSSFMKKAFNIKNNKKKISTHIHSSPQINPSSKHLKSEHFKNEKMAQLRALFEPNRPDLKKKEQAQIIQAWQGKSDLAQVSQMSINKNCQGSKNTFSSHYEKPAPPQKSKSIFKLSHKNTLLPNTAHTPVTPHRRKLASKLRAHNKVTPASVRK